MIDILYLGINMGNCLENKRFFKRYPEAKQDYYHTFHWLACIQNEGYKVAIKHHAGNYKPESDIEEGYITRDITYIDSQLDSYEVASKARMCVSYCSSMILELNGYSNMAKYLYWKRHHKLYINGKCNRHANFSGSYFKRNCPIIPAFYLDPRRRNRQFCMYINDVCINDCNYCRGEDLEIFNPYRLCSYEKFRDKVKEIL